MCQYSISYTEIQTSPYSRTNKHAPMQSINTHTNTEARMNNICMYFAAPAALSYAEEQQAIKDGLKRSLASMVCVCPPSRYRDKPTTPYLPAHTSMHKHTPNPASNVFLKHICVW